jgi:hypothetical protein
MSGEDWQPAREDSRLDTEPFSELCRKVVLCVTEDWFVLSHFKPLIAVLKEVAHAVVVVTRSSGRLSEIEALGARVVDFDFRRSSSTPMHHAASAWALARILEAEDADVVHLVAMKPVVLGGLALKLVPAGHVVVHMTGLGLLAFGSGRLMRLYRAGALRLMASTLRNRLPTCWSRTPTIWHCCAGGASGAAFAILGGAGVDSDAFRPSRRRAATWPSQRSWALIRPGVDVSH